MDLKILNHVEEPDVVTDVDFCPFDGDTFVMSSGNGSMAIGKKSGAIKPRIVAHSKEVSSVQWTTNHILSSSWDGSSKLWNPNTFQSVYECQSQGLCFEAKFQSLTQLIATAESTQRLNIWSINESKPILNLFHGCDVTCLSWHPKRDQLTLTGGADGIIRLWDLRSTCHPIERYLGHHYAIRKIVFGFEGHFLSCSLDKTVRKWALDQPHRHHRLDHHNEFVYGLDISSFEINLAVDCSWDNEVKLFKY